MLFIIKMFVKIRQENITMLTFLIVCPAVFLAGLIDAIGGGGGLISLPIYLLAGLPPHRAIATNKLSSDRKSTRLNSSHPLSSRMPSSA